ELVVVGRRGIECRLAVWDEPQADTAFFQVAFDSETDALDVARAGIKTVGADAEGDFPVGLGPNSRVPLDNLAAEARPIAFFRLHGNHAGLECAAELGDIELTGINLRRGSGKPPA